MTRINTDYATPVRHRTHRGRAYTAVSKVVENLPQKIPGR